ncbi:hypothetical protein cypCar_00048577 [Cyprinus carpio]|nr:hypothetical protein cypCar_00048577 [Cyprinus carpio]
MARLAAFLLVLKTCASVRSTMFSQECSADKEIPCESLSTSAGYTYPLPQNMRDLSTKHCEHGWYFPFNCMITYTVIDWNTNHMHKQDGTGGFPNWGIAVIGIVAVIGTIFASVWYCYRKSGNRWILQNCV